MYKNACNHDFPVKDRSRPLRSKVYLHAQQATPTSNDQKLAERETISRPADVFSVGIVGVPGRTNINKCTAQPQRDLTAFKIKLRSKGSPSHPDMK